MPTFVKQNATSKQLKALKYQICCLSDTMDGFVDEGVNIYSVDGTLTEDRVVSLDGNRLSFENYDLFMIDGTLSAVQINTSDGRIISVSDDDANISITGDGSNITFDSSGLSFTGGNANITIQNSCLTLGAPGTSAASLNLPVSVAPTSPSDGDVWRQDNTNTGLKIRVNGVTKTINLS